MSDRRVIALGNLAGELKASLEAAVRGAELELLLTREPARAFVELERDGALAMLVDMATLGAEQFCKRARGTERLRSVPVIGMSRHPNELGFARVFAWGADDLVPLGAVKPLERRLMALRETEQAKAASFGRAVVAEATTQRRALVGRVLAQAGYEVKFAVDRGAVELYASQAETRLVVISAALGDPRRIIEAAARAGALPTWIVTAEARSVARLASSLSGLDRVAVTSTSGSPEDVLFLANELVFGKGARRREWRALYATPVAFRAAGGDADEYGFSYDASPGGLYVRSLLPCETDQVEVELRLPNRDDRVRLTGKIARRFAFGSGAIASAPPGFSVKLEGPPAELDRWADACQQLIVNASDAMSNPPPAALAEGDPERLPSADAALAVPPATLTIESVVAPLPQSVLEAVEKGSDVAELLASTLDEQTLTDVGSRPVTMDADTLDVREERPSEFAMRAVSDVPPDLLPTGRPDPLGATVAGPAPVRLPLPTPASTPNEASVAEKVPPAPKPVDLHDWESDAETAVRRSRPDVEPSPAPPAPAAIDELELLLPDQMVTLPPTPEASPPPPSARTPEPAPSPPVVPSAVENQPGPPPPRRAGSRSTMIGVAPPAPRLPEAGFAKTQPLPPPRAKAPSSPNLVVPAAPAAAPAPPPAASAPVAQPAPPAVPFDALATPLAIPAQLPPAEVLPPVTTTLPAPLPHRASSPELEIQAPQAQGTSVLLASASSIANAPSYAEVSSIASAQTLSAVVPDAAPPGPKPSPAKPSRGWGAAVAIAALAAALIGGALAVLLPKSETPSPAGNATPEPASLGSTPEPIGAQETSTPEPASPPARAEPPVATASTAPTATTTAAPTTSAPPTQPAAPPPLAAPAAAHAPVSFDVSKLAPDRAALFVRSSATARVFVHGVDYGETNQVLVTSCGTRFVRLGRALGDFVEPGGSFVIKCGKLTELEIQP
ncbi:MAG TPA: hypothetical protein VGK73_35890 [Polyangiaceae bacterium]